MSKLVSIRLGDDLLERLKTTADKAGVGWQTMLKLLLASKLHELADKDIILLPANIRRKPRRREPTPLPPSVSEGVEKTEVLVSNQDVVDLFDELG